MPHYGKETGLIHSNILFRILFINFILLLFVSFSFLKNNIYWNYGTDLFEGKESVIDGATQRAHDLRTLWFRHWSKQPREHANLISDLPFRRRRERPREPANLIADFCSDAEDEIQESSHTIADCCFDAEVNNQESSQTRSRTVVSMLIAEFLFQSAKPRRATKEGQWVLRTPPHIRTLVFLCSAWF